MSGSHTSSVQGPGHEAAQISPPASVYNSLVSPQETSMAAVVTDLNVALPPRHNPPSLPLLRPAQLPQTNPLPFSNSFHSWIQRETVVSVVAPKHSWYTCNKEWGRVSNCEVKLDTVTSRQRAPREPLSGPRSPLQSFHTGLHLHPHPPLIKPAFLKHRHFQNSPFQFCYFPVLFDYWYENTHHFYRFSLKM